MLEYNSIHEIGQRIGAWDLMSEMEVWLLSEWEPVLDSLDKLREYGFEFTVCPINRTVENKGGDVIFEFKSFQDLNQELIELIYDYEEHLIAQHSSYMARW